MAANPISRSFDPLYGKPCWRARRGVGSFLTFEFGEPRLDIDEPRKWSYTFSRSPKIKREGLHRLTTLFGSWHLWIYCCAWSIRFRGEEVAHSESSDLRIDRAVYMLDGQALNRVSVRPEEGKSVFEFDLGGTLLTWPTDTDGEQWRLHEPSGYVLSFRADGAYKHESAKMPSSEVGWLPLTAEPSE